MLTVASYNIHQCVGVDGKRDPHRIARVIRDIKPDIIGLQEVDYRPLGEKKSYQLNYLAEATRLKAVAGPTIHRPDAVFGNALLTGGKVLSVRRHDLSVSRRQPRGAIDAEILLRGQPVRAIVTHLGLSGRERKKQVLRLLDLLADKRSFFTLILGDINEWWPPRFSVRELNAFMGRGPSPRTFPSYFPVFALDRIWFSPRKAVKECGAVRTPLARVASDHLPVRAAIELPAQPPLD